MADDENAPEEWVTGRVMAVWADGSFRVRIDLVRELRCARNTTLGSRLPVYSHRSANLRGRFAAAVAGS